MSELTEKCNNQMLFLLDRIKVRCNAGDTITEAQKTATRETSKKYDVEGGTISDLQTRRLGIKGIAKWRDLLENWLLGNPEPIERVVLAHTESTRRIAIRDFLRYL